MNTPGSGENTDPSAELLNMLENSCVGALGITKAPTIKFSMTTATIMM